MAGKSYTARMPEKQPLDKYEAGQLIRQRREARGYTQEDVVANTTIPVSTYVSELENGKVSVGRSKHFPSLAQFLRLSEADIRAINPAAVIEVRAVPEPAEQLQRELSPNLALAAELYADRPRYAGFGTPRWLNYLNAFNFYDGQEPEPEGWAELFLTLKQSNVTPGEDA